MTTNDDRINEAIAEVLRLEAQGDNLRVWCADVRRPMEARAPRTTEVQP